jgi:phytanoyl-CoA hydroxylase
VAAENYIPLGIIESHETQPIPVSKGSVIILSKWTERASLDNVSDSLRWSFDLRYQVTGQPSGRPAFPSFVARSRGDQNTVMTDPAAYAKQWDDARAAILNGSYSGVVFEQDRWAKNATDPLCA